LQRLVAAEVAIVFPEKIELIALVAVYPVVGVLDPQSQRSGAVESVVERGISGSGYVDRKRTS